jgi:hypothetical protein
VIKFYASLAPTALMPAVVGTPYTQNLVAHGASDNFTWSVTPSLPSGLTWDDSNHQLYGTVTDASQVGKAFSLVVELTASDVIMDPLTFSLGITVQSAPAVASDMPPSEQIDIWSIAASGLVIAALAAYAYNRYKAAKANAKTAETIQQGDTNVNNATGGDPKSISQLIVQTDNAALPTVEGNIPVRQSLLNDINRQVKELSAQIAKNEATIKKLDEYFQAHRRDNTDAAVTDEDLRAEGYDTLGDVISGLMDLKQLNGAQTEEISTATQWSNQETTKTALVQNRVSEAAIGANNLDYLLEE